MKLSVDRRRPQGCQHGDYWVSREAYKGRWAFRVHPLGHHSPAPSFSSLFSSSTLFDLLFLPYRGPGQLPVIAMARRPHGGVDLGRCTIVTTIRTVHFALLYFPLDPPLIQSLRTMQDLVSTRRCSHITAEGWLCLSRGDWGGDWG